MVSRKYLLLAAVSLSVVALDQWTKFLVLGELTVALDGATETGARVARFLGSAPTDSAVGTHYGQKRFINLSDDFFRLRYAENPGAAFGLLRGVPEGIRGPLFHLISIGAVVLIFYYVSRLSGTDPKERWALWGLPLVLGGAVGNYVDRLARGFVIDFLEAHWFDKAAWPSFNIADSAICIGVGLLVVDSFVRKEQPALKESHASDSL